VRPGPRYASLYQINTEVWLTELSKNLGRPATLDDIPDSDLDHLAEKGFDCARDTRVPCASTFTPTPNYQNKLARFLENHDEPRAAATFAPDEHQAAAVITFLSPGLRFFHQGQFEGNE
jgi:hypothetical protein